MRDNRREAKRPTKDKRGVDPFFHQVSFNEGYEQAVNDCIDKLRKGRFVTDEAFSVTQAEIMRLSSVLF